MRRPSTFAGWLAGPLVITGVVMVLFGGVRAASAPVPGQQGIDTSLPLTDSALTVKGRGSFANLSITVNQTQKLNNQAISITWQGGVPTQRAPGRFANNFLQIFQCWGDDDGTHPENPGPPPAQCQQGASGGTPTGLSSALFPEPLTIGRVISRQGWDNFPQNSTLGYLEPKTGEVWMPFRSVDGTVVNVQRNPDFNPFIPADYWLNPYYNNVTTNEIPGAVTGPNGTGAELFQVLTGNEASGLGCGKRAQIVAGERTVPKCWLVIVPRSDQATENAGTPMAGGGDRVPVSTSPLAPTAWQNRISIPLEFNPVDSACQFSDVDRRMVGGELVLPAVASWQPALCSIPSLPPFSYGPVADATARSLVAQGIPAGPGLAMASRPLTGPSITPDNPVVYTPVSVSGLVIGFNVERKADIGASAEMLALEGVRIAEMNLTPRLVAKLLSQSYTGQTTIVSASPYDWANKNPVNLSKDPDFRRFNPEFELLFVGQQRTFSGLQLPAGNSDAALQLWEWVLSDPEAAAWLGGQPDEWGMTVNPNYRTDAAGNATGIGFGDPMPSSFPKADPHCYQGPNQGPADSIKPPLVCGTDYMPYSRSLAATAQAARSASDAAKLDVNPLAESASQVWKSLPPQSIGERAMLAFTDTPSAVQFGLQVARLSRAGDNGSDRSFIAPTAEGLAAGVAAMAPRDVPDVLEPVPGADAPGAYPLTAITYAAMTPLKLDAAARADFATFLDYATGPGQVPGLDLGQLPRGYLPLPEALTAKSATAIEQVRSLAPTTTSTTVSTANPSVSTPSSNRTTSRPRSTGSSSGTSSGTTTTVAAVAPESTVESTTTSTTVDPADVPPSTTPTILTPAVELARNRLAIPGLGIIALGAALGALEITKRPRRGLQAPDSVEIDEVGP